MSLERDFRQNFKWGNHANNRLYEELLAQREREIKILKYLIKTNTEMDYLCTDDVPDGVDYPHDIGNIVWGDDPDLNALSCEYRYQSEESLTDALLELALEKAQES